MLHAAALLALANVAQPFQYLDELRTQERAVAEHPQAGRERNIGLMMLAYAQSYVDASEKVGVTYYGQNGDPPAASSDDEERARKLLASHEPREALAAIVEAARDRQIVIINEAHVMPRHRAFSTRLALELRKLGFEYLAVETLDNRSPDTVASLQARGYPVVEDGYYSKEPVFGDFLRQSLAAGYKMVAYEFARYTDDYDKLDPVDAQIQRENGQAQNIIDSVLAKDPRARIFIHVGHGHVEKGSSEFMGKQIEFMAERLKQKTGIDPLCIQQTRSSWPRQIKADRPLTDVVLKTFRGESFVMARREGAGFINSGGVDIEVWHRPETLRRGRPDWLSMGGYRRPKVIPAKLLPKQGRRLLQAFVEGESPDAVPIDQVLVTAGEPPPVFMLPKGKYRFAYQD